jgi:hypothetical protein
LSFERAVAVGAEQIEHDDRPLLFALDITFLAQQKIEPLPDLAVRTGVSEARFQLLAEQLGVARAALTNFFRSMEQG